MLVHFTKLLVVGDVLCIPARLKTTPTRRIPGDQDDVVEGGV